MSRTIATGVQDFGKLIRKKCFYVDKTLFIKEWWENEDDITLITRPRRFGKTLTMDMVNRFFSVEHKEDAELFQGLSIWKEEKYQKLQGTYPVIFLSFAGIKENDFDSVYDCICELISRLYFRFSFLLDSPHLSPGEKAFYNKIAHMDAKPSLIKTSINRLSEYLFRYYGKRVIILLDEYDTPMQEANVKGYWDQLADFIGGLFHAAFKTNPYLERSVMTGITRVSKESIFSELDNLEVVTAFSEKYKCSFGFTGTEVHDALAEYNLEDKESEVRFWYDGFQFGGCSGIYNPWSIINYLGKKQFKPYWANTSSNNLVNDLVKNGSRDIKAAIERLLQGKCYTASFEEEVVYNQLNFSNGAVCSLLVAGGYLKVKDARVNENQDMEYELAITNFEVIQMFRKMITGWFYPNTEKFHLFCNALDAGDVKAMQRSLREDALVILSSYDTVNENAYHMFVLGLIACLQYKYEIRSNIEAGFGRCDTILYPRDRHSDGIVLEYKKAKGGSGSKLQESVKDALVQILDRRYFADLEAKGIIKERIRIYGLAFAVKKVVVDGGYLCKVQAVMRENRHP